MTQVVVFVDPDGRTRTFSQGVDPVVIDVRHLDPDDDHGELADALLRLAGLDDELLVVALRALSDSLPSTPSIQAPEAITLASSLPDAVCRIAAMPAPSRLAVLRAVLRGRGIIG